MKILFIRHGESRSNAGEVKSSDNDEINHLTTRGQHQIAEVSAAFSGRVDYIFSSPLTRARESAAMFSIEHQPKEPIIVDDRLREINYGNGINDKSSPEMEHISKLQIAGDYDVRFGVTGENKREIVVRFFDFLLSLRELPINSSVVAFSHGRAISITNHEVCDVLRIKPDSTHTDNGSIKVVDLTPSDFEKIERHLVKII